MQERSHSIVAAALVVFGERGFEKASIAQIAALAGTSDGLIYRYFTGKRELLAAALAHFYGQTLELAEREIAAGQGFEGKLHALIRSHIRVFGENTGICRLFIAEVRNFDDYVGSSQQGLNRKYTALLIPVLEAGMDEGVISHEIDHRLVRDMVFGGMEHVAWRHIGSGLTMNVDRLARLVSQFVIGGLKAL
ncbi:TetR/AcrR family transcriptional regulator [Novosphingobium sp.]|uniref:TetR/AcrR family transcriptional regulator n=1 Tax=Novosphingobium sp. TaxID=1874826 RepID=UPI0033403FA4